MCAYFCYTRVHHVGTNMLLPETAAGVAMHELVIILYFDLFLCSRTMPWQILPPMIIICGMFSATGLGMPLLQRLFMDGKVN
jgi:ABC-type multidrug transport system permease subunit